MSLFNRGDAVLMAERQAAEARIAEVGPVSPGRLKPLHEVLDLAKDQANTTAIAARCDDGLALYPGHPMYVQTAADCAARLQWFGAQEGAQKALDQAGASRQAAIDSVEHLQAATSDLEAKLSDRRERQAAGQAQLDKVMMEIGAAEVDGKPTGELRKRLGTLQQDCAVDQAAIATLIERLREPAAALAVAKLSSAAAEATYVKAQKALREQQLRTLAGSIVALIVDGTSDAREQAAVRRYIDVAWNLSTGFQN